MSWGKILICCVVVAIFTCAGYFSAWYGADQFEATRQKNFYFMLGKILLWPWCLWDFLRGFIFPEQRAHSFYAIGISQFIGYFVLFYLGNKIYEKFFSSPITA